MPPSDPAMDAPQPSMNQEIQIRSDMVRQALERNPYTDVGDYLPTPGSAHRKDILLAVIPLDLHYKARIGQPTRLEAYLQRFAPDLTQETVPVELLYEEYRVRHRFADKPQVAEYRSRFPLQFEAFRQYVQEHPLPSAEQRDAQGTLDYRQPLDSWAFEQSLGAPKPPLPVPMPEAPPPAPAKSRPSRADSDEPDYKLLKLLGKGAYGKVYLAEAPGGVPVAVKQLLRGIDHPVGQSELEALETIKKLSHPYLIQLHQFWIDGDQIYVVMELAEGSLADRYEECKEQGLPGIPVAELVPYFAEVAEALDFLHSKNITHRDVKPQNLLYLKGHAKVADLGLARSHSHSIQMTTVAQECGTPLYMAPEVWRKKVSKYSDQYSLAATYIAARLGRPLFETEYIDQLIVKHLESQPNLDPLPRAEQRVLLRALAKEPEARFPSCMAFVQALREATAPPVITSPWTRRAVLAGGLALSGGLIYALSRLADQQPLPPPVPPPPPAVAWLPADWTPPENAEIIEDREGQKLYRELTRPVGETHLTAILIPRVQPNDPASFYMLKDKVTNQVFMAHSDTLGQGFDVKNWLASGQEPLPGVWKDGAMHRKTGEKQGIAGDLAQVPVVGVTAVEAALAAEQLGGLLPTFEQWYKAVGARAQSDNGDRASPVGNPPYDMNTLALNRDAPLPIGATSGEVSPLGIAQLISNGLEWTRDTIDGQRFDPHAAPPINPGLIVTGTSWDSRHVQTYAEIRRRQNKTYDWFDTRAGIGFRIVLEAPR